MQQCTQALLVTFGAFCIVCMAGHTFGKILSPLGMPSITLFIFFGLLCGPVGFDLVSSVDARVLEWIDQMALGFIGLSAGGHFHVSEMASALGPALTVLTSLVLITYSGCLLSVMTLGQHIIPFFKGINDAQQMAAGLLIACLSVARSPSSAIAIISELNAKGPFTTVVLAVTVMMDVVVVVLFSISLMVARALDDPSVFMTPREASEDPAIGQARLYRVIGRIVLIEFSQKVLLSALFGVLLGHMLPLFFGWEPRKPTWPLGRSATWAALICASLGFGLRAVIVLMQRASLPLTGWLLFFEEEMAAELDTSDWLNPLICTMVAGFTIVNYTNAGKAFHEAVDSLSGPIYLLFFVFTGCSMDVGVLARNLPACLLIFFTRASLIVVSTYIGGVAAQAPEEFRCRYWMAFLTQAGVTLGLAKDASSHFTWGPDFNATIVAVSVINQVFGPPLMKAALRGAGESHHNYVPRKLEDVSGVGTIGAIGKANLRLTSRPQPRGALVIAEDAHSLHASSEASLVVARLRARGWEVMLADEKLAVTAAEASERQRMDKTAEVLINRLPLEDPDEDPERYAQCMRLLWLAASMKSFDVVVCLLSTDDANVAMCELIGDMVPMLQFTRKRDPSPPQVLVTLSGRAEAYRDTFSEILPSPLVLPRRTAMPSLVCEVLHPAAHWSGSLDKEEPDGGAGRISHGDLDGDDADGNEDETPQHSPVRSPLESAPVSRHKPGAAEAFSAIKFTPTKRGSKFGRPAQADLL